LPGQNRTLKTKYKGDKMMYQMKNNKLSSKEISELEPPFDIFELYADLDLTKHIGSLKATKELIELCHINKGKYVLDVGCGVGATPCYIVKKHSCRVVGVDISEKMIDRSNERAKRKNVENRVEFRVADAQNLPFEDALFDVVIGESVTVFLEDKRRAVGEYVRVTKPGGYVGLNETIWIKTPPPELVEYLSRITGAKPETSDGWKGLLEGSGLRDIVVRTHKTNVLDELSRIRRYGLKDYLRVWYRFLSLYIASPALRRLIKETLITPKNLIKYTEYGIYVGRK